MKTIVVYSFLGTTLDQFPFSNRWDKWRPSVALCQHEDLLLSRYHLLTNSRYDKLTKVIMEDIRTVSPETTVQTETIEFTNPWDFEEVYGKLYDLCENANFKPEEEEYLFHITTGTHVAQICIFLLTESRHFPGKLIQTSPSGESGSAREGSYTIIDLDLSRYDRIANRFRQKSIDDISYLKSGIETRNREFNGLIELIERVALNSRHPILLTGPTGAGKSLLARKIYELRKSRGHLTGQFVEANCATLRGDQAMSALFGHKKGSFTGALNDRPGLLKSADGGILFLDEIGELGLDEQAMLLRAIEEKKFYSLGSDSESESDFQLICGTNRDLLSEVSSRRFREDLLARINLWTFRLPSLKDRPEDIEPNIHFELLRFEEVTGRKIAFNREALDEYLRFAVSSEALWKANFRDLNGSIIRLCTLSNGGRIHLPLVIEEIRRLKSQWGESQRKQDTILAQYLSGEQIEALDLFDRLQLEAVIPVCLESRNLAHAGRSLFGISRENKKDQNDSDRLRKYLIKFGIDPRQFYH